MSFLADAAAIGGAYIILTLSSTSLAKLRNWRGAALILLRQQITPAGLAATVAVAVAVTETAVALLMALGVSPLLTGCFAAMLFTLFACYRLVAAARTKSMECPCTGPAAGYSPATKGAVMAVVLTGLLQAGLSCLWAIAGHDVGMWGRLLGPVAWLLPFTVLLVGLMARSIPARRYVMRINQSADFADKEEALLR
jgi:hypothetical protein